VGQYLNSEANFSINQWNVVAITNMTQLFSVTRNAKAEFFDQDISNWDTWSGMKMNSLFFGAAAFHGALPWNAASLTDLKDAFSGATAFNSNSSSWDI
jgi:hypothetical protein